MGNLFVRLSGAKHTVGNTTCKSLWNKFTYSCPANRTIHRVEQNKLLFEAFMGSEADFKMEFYQPAGKEDRQKADSILNDLGYKYKKLLGVHAGPFISVP